MPLFFKIFIALPVFGIMTFSACSVQQFHDEPVYSISIVSFSPHTIPNYTAGDGSIINFTVTIKNNGSDITNPASVFCMIGVTNAGGMSFSQLNGSVRNITFDTAPPLLSGQTYTFNFTKDISKVGWIGANYFYALAAAVTNNILLTNTNSYASVQFNSTSVVSSLPASAPYNWTSSAAAGGVDPAGATAVSSGLWNTGSLTASTFKWYKTTVVVNSSYQVYWDDASEGSSSYSANTMVFIYDNNGTTLLDSADSAYYNPRTVKPTLGTTMYILVSNVNGPLGSFAFGIK